MMTPTEARAVLRHAELVCSADTVVQAVRRVATEISGAFKEEHPLLLGVMSGAVVFAGQLLPLLEFPLDFDYLHLTRYGDATRGGNIEWKAFPGEVIAGRAVLVVDDILDEGHTMLEIRQRVMEAGARSFSCAVFADKAIGRPKPIAADFVGITVPGRYVFGFGMDIKGAWRNLPAIYALRNGGA